ncbi:hypothetical protein FGIG_10058 [Fasciola gigantica]|uniref:Uncharacterized protein n=1 Tax=Fasciola gigantica TaxID=46835 RepID=A0A504YB24_FASGI|nr:hypothetical protein FGIG_10058 [Fasciola gigantica]
MLMLKRLWLDEVHFWWRVEFRLNLRPRLTLRDDRLHIGNRKGMAHGNAEQSSQNESEFHKILDSVSATWFSEPGR